MAKEYTELQLEAKAAGVKGWHVKLAETLKAELADLSAPEVNVTEDTPVVEKVAPAKPQTPSAPSDELTLLKLMVGYTWDQARGNLLMLGRKSRFAGFEDLIEKNWKEEK